MKAADATPASVDDYIAAFPRDVQMVLQRVRATIKSAAPDAMETIKYRVPTFVLNENLVHFAAFKHHVGFYPAPSAIAKFRNELSAYKSAKGSVQFPIDQPMPLGLIKKIVKFRVQEVRGKARPRPKTSR